MEGERISTTEVKLADCPAVGLTLGKQAEGGGETEINDDGGGGDYDDGDGGGDYDDDGGGGGVGEDVDMDGGGNDDGDGDDVQTLKKKDVNRSRLIQCEDQY